MVALYRCVAPTGPIPMRDPYRVELHTNPDRATDAWPPPICGPYRADTYPRPLKGTSAPGHRPEERSKLRICKVLSVPIGT